MYKYIPCDQSNDYFIAKLGPIISCRFESKVFELAKKMIAGYNKGFWRAANANGAPLLIIDDTANITIKDDIKQRTYTMSHEMASIIICLYAYDHILNELSFANSSAETAQLINMLCIHRFNLYDQAKEYAEAKRQDLYLALLLD